MDAVAVLDGLAKADDDVSREEANIEDDTLRSVWSSTLKPISNKSKPHFLFYKGGRLRRKIAGVDTPLLIKVINFLMEAPAQEV